MNEREQIPVGAFLRQGAWFRGLSPSLQEQLLRVAAIRTFARGHLLQIEGDEGIGLVAVVEGSVRCLRHASDEAPALIYVGFPGFWFGHMSVVARRQMIVSVVARSAVRALVVTQAAFRRVAAAAPDLLEAVNAVIYERTDIMFRFQAEARELGPDARLQVRLADLADQRRTETLVTGRAVALDLTQAELAELVGLSRQEVNIRLQALQAEGWVHLAQRRIRVLDPAALRAHAVGPH